MRGSLKMVFAREKGRFIRWVLSMKELLLERKRMGKVVWLFGTGVIMLDSLREGRNRVRGLLKRRGQFLWEHGKIINLCKSTSEFLILFRFIHMLLVVRYK